MTWSSDLKPHGSPLNGSITPKEVLYYYDGPILFTANIGLYLTLFYKLEEGDSSDFFLTTKVEEDTVGALKDGLISLRGVIEATDYWIIELKNSLSVGRSWHVLRSQVPEALLPEPGLGLSPGSSALPDTVAQANAFFAVKFMGDGLGKGEISFRRFKELTDSVYTATKRLLTPMSLAGRRSGDVFDLPISEPHFASLLIAIQKPRVDTALIRARQRQRTQAPSEDYEAASNSRRARFFETMDAVTKEAAKSNVSSATAAENFVFLEAVSGMLPSPDMQITSTEFTGESFGGRQHIVVNQEVGNRLREAYASASTRPVAITGIVEIVNAPSNTVVLQDEVSGRQVTCKLLSDWFQALDGTGSLRHGSKLHAVGNLTRRKQRDSLDVTKLPELKEEPQAG